MDKVRGEFDEELDINDVVSDVYLTYAKWSTKLTKDQDYDVTKRIVALFNNETKQNSPLTLNGKTKIIKLS